MERLRCGETSCVHHEGGCVASIIQVVYKDNPLCDTYEAKSAEKDAAPLHIVDEDNGYFGNAAPSEPLDEDEIANNKKTGIGKITCTVTECLHNHDSTCRAPWVTVGIPKGKNEIDAECKTFVLGS